MKIEPMPLHGGVGYGFCSREEIPGLQPGYNLVKHGPFYNYHFTPDNYQWPERIPAQPQFKIDGFSPNLNKKLHIGHLRNLVVASSLVWNGDGRNANASQDPCL